MTPDEGPRHCTIIFLRHWHRIPLSHLVEMEILVLRPLTLFSRINLVLFF